ncbi:hypothetical protein [Dichelobacter nodosus]|uniref:hypothetical protein n=1 Tax=Dichelobacter nodosus TaxID=870 RepID=UPI000681935E|nr:hypothetical protein [Dichelobacter nodosus]KNZ39946.1 hypothetical protein AKG33_00945 [Dichelobacter nodosus]
MKTSAKQLEHARNYIRRCCTIKAVNFHTQNDADLIEKVEALPRGAFSKLVRDLLREHFDETTRR